jgi:predicted GIY-YIG superfamily endonuclease
MIKREEVVYLGTDSFHRERNIYKIGKTENLPNRIKQHKTGNPTFYIVGFTPLLKEIDLHRLFKEQRVKGTKEWFELTNDDIIYLINHFLSVNLLQANHKNKLYFSDKNFSSRITNIILEKLKEKKISLTYLSYMLGKDKDYMYRIKNKGELFKIGLLPQIASIIEISYLELIAKAYVEDEFNNFKNIKYIR